MAFQPKAWLAPFKLVEPEPVVRFETEPGVRMQADFTHVRRGCDALIALVATMGFSRVTFVKFTTHCFPKMSRPSKGVVDAMRISVFDERERCLVYEHRQSAWMRCPQLS